MSRYYFHIRDKSGLIRDNTGLECASLSEAHHEGLKLAKCVVSDMHEVGDVVDGQTIEVSDEAGAVLEIVELRDHVPDVADDL